MKRSSDRILTTHVGSLVRPPEVLQDILIKVAGKPIDEAAFQKNVSKGVSETVRKQAEIGIDIPSDGEFSKPTFSSYVAERLSGLGPSPITVKPYAYPILQEEFPGFMAEYNAMYTTIWMPKSIPTDIVKEAGDSAELVAEISAWEDPPRAAPTELAPILAVDGFAGPLDWLLEMAQARKIDLARLSIAALIEAFATALEAALARRVRGRAAELGSWGAWLVMAASLAFLRSRLLLSDSPEAKAAEDEAEALRHRLVSRAQVRTAADWLERRPQLGRDVFACGTGDRRYGGGWAGDISELLRACLVVLRVPEQAGVYRPRPPPLWQVSDAIARLRQLLGELPDDSPLTAFVPNVGNAEPGRALRCRVAVSSTLVAGLELARAGALALDQDAPWTPVRVQQRDTAMPS